MLTCDFSYLTSIESEKKKIRFINIEKNPLLDADRYFTKEKLF